MDNKPEGYELWPHDDPSVIQDTSFLEGQYKTNLKMPGIKASFESSLESDFTYKTFEKVEDSVLDKVLPNNKFLTPEQAKESPDYREGIDVSNGISQYMLKRASEVYDRREEQAYAISQMPDGLGSSIEKGAASLIGNALDPATIAAAAVAPEIVGVRSAAFLAKATLPSTKLAMNVGVGLGEAAIAGTPSAAADLIDENKYLPEQDKGAHAMADLASFMAFGGVIRGITGVKVPISKQAAQYANQVSIHQMSEGFFPNTDLIVQQGYFDERKLPAQENTIDESSDKLKKALTNDISDMTNDDQIEDVYNNVIAPLEAKDVEGVKNPTAKSLMKLLNDNRSAINRLKSVDHLNNVMRELRAANPRAEVKNIRKSALSIIKKDVDVYKEENGVIQSKLNDMRELSKARLLVRNLKRNLNGSTLAKKLDEPKKQLKSYAIHAEDSLKDALKNIDDTLENFQNYLPQHILTDKTHKNTSQIISDVLDDAQNLPDTLSQSTKSIMQSKLPNYIKRAIQTMQKRAEYRTKDETQHLLSVLFEDERKMIKQDSRGIKKRLSSDDMGDAERYLLEKDLNALENRLEQVNKGREDYGDFWRTKQAFDASLLKKYDILQTLKRNEVYNLMLQNTGEPVSKSELENAVSDSLDPGNELPLNSNEVTIFKNAAMTVPDDLDKAYDNAETIFNSIDKTQTQAVRDEMASIDKATHVISSALEKAAKCLGGVK